MATKNKRLPSRTVLAKARATMGLSQTAVGKLFGVSMASISRWEAGVFKPTRDDHWAWARALCTLAGKKKLSDLRKKLDPGPKPKAA